MLPLQATPSMPVQVVRGVHLGVLTGVIPALVAFSLEFLFRYVTVPALAVVGLTVALAGVNGGLLALNDPAVRDSVRETTIVTALLVVMMLALVAHNRGDSLGAEFPHRLSLRPLRERRLSGGVVEFVGTRNQVRVRVVGEVADVEGYPPLPEDLRREIRDGDWAFPADVPLSELETRFADRLCTEFDLADASIAIDERARATVAAVQPADGPVEPVPSTGRTLAAGDTVYVVTRPDALRRVESAAGTASLHSSESSSPSSNETTTRGG